MRMISLQINDNVVMQVDGTPKTFKKGEHLICIETGVVNEYGSDHLCGVVSSDIANTFLVKQNIDQLKSMNVEQRNNWFKNIFNDKPRIIKIKSDLIGNRLAGDSSKPIFMVGSAEMKWDN